MTGPRLIYAVCTWNRAGRLPALLRAMRAQECPVPFEVLVVDNNSTDGTRGVVERIAAEQGGAPVRYVFEPEQGIVPARNRAIEEALRVEAESLVFIDDDELPMPGLLVAAWNAIEDEGADCVGGRVRVQFERDRPSWLVDELLGFLAAVDHGTSPFWIEDRGTPIWTANVGYRLALFRTDPTLRFDLRYDRKAKGIGGGEDAAMFWELLERGARIRYRPDMVVSHLVEPWRLRRRYFLRLHAAAGYRYGRFRFEPRGRQMFGVPFWLPVRAAMHGARAAGLALRGRPALREAMNACHALGIIAGTARRWWVHRNGGAGKGGRAPGGRAAALALLLCVIAAGGALHTVQARTVGQWMPTAAELRTLPGYCQDRFRYGPSRKHPVIARWYRTFGDDFIHIHHFCAGLNFLNRAKMALGDKRRRAFNYQRAYGNLSYIITHVSPRFPLLPAARYYRGQALEGMGRTAEAVRDYLAAIELKPAYPPPYVALAELHRRAGRME
ncbi:MAG TPA: glycosyltransferase, partial [Bryobacterales bacterium]|nr:glycosyltransferase [Bryobacterales bacterium]